MNLSQLSGSRIYPFTVSLIWPESLKNVFIWPESLKNTFIWPESLKNTFIWLWSEKGGFCQTVNALIAE